MIRISKWNETFECAKSRKLQRMNWVQCPTGLHSHGYLELAAMGKDGLFAFGVFQALVQWSATLPAKYRGNLCRTDGTPMTINQVAMVCHLSPTDLPLAVSILSSESVRWLEVAERSATDLPLASHSSASDLPSSATPLPTSPTHPPHLSSYRTEQDITEHNRTNTPLPPLEEKPQLPDTALPGAAPSSLSVDVTPDDPPEPPPNLPAKPRKPPDPIIIPDTLAASDDFLEAWAEWETHRKEIKKPLTPTQRNRQLLEMAEKGPEKSAAAIRFTTGKGWQGLVWPEQEQSRGHRQDRGSPPEKGGYSPAPPMSKEETQGVPF